MDARALNLEQAELIFNPSAEVDSVFEVLQELRGDIPRSKLVELTRLTRRIAVSNSWEGNREVGLCGTADRLVRDLRDLHLNGGMESVLAAKSIARLLRAPLKTLGAPVDDLLAWVDALREVDEVLGRAPEDQVLSPTVRYDLGERKYALLEQLAKRRKARR